MRRTFTALEIAKILRSQNVLEFDLEDGLKAVQMATSGGLVWTIHRGGKEHQLRDASAAELAAISAILWEKISPQFLDSKEILDAELTPENLTGENDEDVIIPDDLRESTDPARRVLDDLLTPSRLIDIIQNPGLARKLADGTATPKEKLEAELMPDELIDGVEDKSLEGQLTPDNLRTEK